MKIFPILSTLAVLIAGQDTKTVIFSPTSGNGSSLGMESKIEPVLQSDMTRAILATLAPPPPSPQPMLPSDYFFPGKDFSILVTLRERDGVV